MFGLSVVEKEMKAKVLLKETEILLKEKELKIDLLEKQKKCEHDFNISVSTHYSGSIPYKEILGVCRKCLYSKIENKW